jgi:hypothetical protein
MRIWSLHPQYLDAKGLVALWRETLLAKHVLQGKTKGYKNHPQLIRFKKTKNPVDSIDHYLSYVLLEAQSRDYHFDASKIACIIQTVKTCCYKRANRLRSEAFTPEIKNKRSQKVRQLRSIVHLNLIPCSG